MRYCVGFCDGRRPLCNMSVDCALRLPLLVAQRSHIRLSEANKGLLVAPSTAHFLLAMLGVPRPGPAGGPLRLPRPRPGRRRWGDDQGAMTGAGIVYRRRSEPIVDQHELYAAAERKACRHRNRAPGHSSRPGGRRQRGERAAGRRSAGKPGSGAMSLGIDKSEWLATAAGLVTVAASGIGSATVNRLVAAGARVVAADLRLPGDGHGNRTAITRRCTCTATCGRVDFVVAGAGIADTASIADGDLEHWRVVLETNVLRVFHAVRGALPARQRAVEGISSSSR